MKTSISKLRLLIEQLVLEEIGMHRCMNGDLVPNDSEACYGDVCDRIDDATYHRNEMTGGTANRAYYNGILADLRKKRRKLNKVYSLEI
jgi:hypothetical protein